MLRALRSSSKRLQSLGNASQRHVPRGTLLPSESYGFHLKGAGFVAMREYSSQRYELFPGGPIDPEPPKEGEGAPAGEQKEEESTGSSHMPDEYLDLPKGPTHKEMIAARRHYLKRQVGVARRPRISVMACFSHVATAHLLQRMYLHCQKLSTHVGNSSLFYSTTHETGNQEQLKNVLDHISRGVLQPDAADFINLIKDCTSMHVLPEGKCVHSLIISHGLERDRLIGNYLVKMYLQCGSLEDACEMFDRMQNRDVILWTELIAAYARRGHCMDALQLFRIMRLEGVMPDKITFVTALNACCDTSALAEGCLIHSHIGEGGFMSNNVIVETALVNMYAKCGRIEEARRMFYKMPSRDVVSWNAMIAVHAENEKFDEAMQIFQHMNLEGTKPNKSTFVATLNACRDLEDGKLIHSCSVESGLELHVAVATGLVDMYGKSGALEESRFMFDRVHRKDVILWNALIAVYAHQGELGKESLVLFHQMQLDGYLPDRVTYLNVLSACANMAELAEGRLIHSRILELGDDVKSDFSIQNALAAMYGKCGSLEDARKVFDNMPQRTIVSWNGMIAAYAQHGHPQDAFQSLRRMQHQGVKPDSITFVSILSACSRAGLLREGRRYFELVTQHLGIVPSTEHYGCMIDLLGRVGRLDEAENLISSMRVRAADVVLWKTLLGACRIYGDVERGKRAAERVVEMDPSDSAAYVVLCNIYAGDLT